MTYGNSGGIWLIPGDGTGQFAPPILVPTQYDGYAARITDMDGDGITDLLLGRSSPHPRTKLTLGLFLPADLSCCERAVLHRKRNC